MGAYAIECNMNTELSADPSEHSTDHPGRPGKGSVHKITYKSIKKLKNVPGAPSE